MRLRKIKEIMHQGNYTEALDLIDKLDQKDMLTGLILKSRIFELKGQLKEALDVAEYTIKESQIKGTKLQQLLAFINLGYAHLGFRNIPELAKTIQEGEQIFSGIEQEPQVIKKECQGSLAYLQGYLHFYTGEIQQSLDCLENSLIIRQALDNQHDIVETLTAIGWVHTGITGKDNLAFDYFQRSLIISEKLNNKTAIAHSLNRLGVYYHEIGNYDQALSYWEKSLSIYQELENKRMKGRLFNNLSHIYIAKENYDLALNYMERSLSISQELEMIGATTVAYENIGWILKLKGDLDPALDYSQRSLQLHKEEDNKIGVIAALQSVGEIQFLKGDLNSALDYYNNSLIKGKEAGSKISIAWALSRLAMVYSRQGELGLASDTIDQSLKMFTEMDNEVGITFCYSEQGIINRLLGKYENSLKSLEKALNLTKRFMIGGNTALLCSYFLFHLILVTQELDAIDKAKEYLKQMQELRQESESKFVKLRTQLAEAIVLKMNKRVAKKFQAQHIFQAIVDEEILDFNLTVLAMLNLCELLILEVKISETAEDLLQKITHLSEKFYDIAQRQNSSLFTVMALLLQTKLALVQGEVEEANNLLITAKRIASEKKLMTLLTRVKSEQETVQTEFDKWHELIQRKATIKELLEQVNLANYIVKVKQIQEAWMRPSDERINQ